MEMWETLKIIGENANMEFLEICSDNIDDIEQIEKIEQESFGIGAIDQWVLKPISRYGKILALKECGKVVGICELMWKWNSREVYIFSFAIRKDWQGRGWGKLLMEKTVAFLEKEDVEKIMLTVTISNISAIKLYEKLGFTKERVLKDEYGDGVDKCLMMKRLNSSIKGV